MAWLCISYYLKLSSIVSRTTVAGFSRIIIILCWSSMRNPFFLDSNTMSCLSLCDNLVLLGVDIFNVFQKTTECEFLVTPWAAEWLFTSVSSLTFLQIIKECTILVTGCAAEWFSTSMSSLMFFQTTMECEFLVTPWAAEWLFTSVSSLMFFQTTMDSWMCSLLSPVEVT